MSSMPIAKDQQTAYQRWELAAVTDDGAYNSGHLHYGQSKQQASSLDAMNAKQVKDFFENARKDGYAQGLQEGYLAGIDQAKVELERDKATLLNIATNFNDAVQANDEKIAENLLKLALDISKAMLKSQLAVKPLLILPIVKQAMHYLPLVQKPARILLNPMDAAIVKQHLLDELTAAGWLLVEDPALEQGGCLVETAVNQIDASNHKRWQRICDALGQQNDWMS